MRIGFYWLLLAVVIAGGSEAETQVTENTVTGYREHSHRLQRTQLQVTDKKVTDKKGYRQQSHSSQITQVTENIHFSLIRIMPHVNINSYNVQ